MRIADRLLDLLYPARCVSCGAGDGWWCVVCRADVERLTHAPCPRCLSVELKHDVNSCEGKSSFTSVTASGFYHSPPLRRLIAAVKYDGVTAAGQDVEPYLREVLTSRSSSWMPESDLIIVPMPLAERRERTRGFNQAMWIAERLNAATGLMAPIVNDLLIRKTGAYAQADLAHDPALRGANVAGQFRATRRIVSPVLLVDDVVTTGSTATEAARALIAAGAPRVHLFALAVGK